MRLRLLWIGVQWGVVDAARLGCHTCKYCQNRTRQSKWHNSLKRLIGSLGVPALHLLPSCRGGTISKWPPLHRNMRWQWCLCNNIKYAAAQVHTIEQNFPEAAVNAAAVAFINPVGQLQWEWDHLLLLPIWIEQINNNFSSRWKWYMLSFALFVCLKMIHCTKRSVHLRTS